MEADNLDFFELNLLSQLQNQVEDNKKYFQDLHRYKEIHEMLDKPQIVEYKDFKEKFTFTDKPQAKAPVVLEDYSTPVAKRARF